MILLFVPLGNASLPDFTATDSIDKQKNSNISSLLSDEVFAEDKTFCVLSSFEDSQEMFEYKTDLDLPYCNQESAQEQEFIQVAGLAPLLIGVSSIASVVAGFGAFKFGVYRGKEKAKIRAEEREREREREKTIVDLVKTGVEISDISAITGLSEDEINAIVEKRKTQANNQN